MPLSIGVLGDGNPGDSTGPEANTATEMASTPEQIATLESIGSGFDEIYSEGADNGGTFGDIATMSDQPDMTDILSAVQASMENRYAETEGAATV